MIKPAGTPFDEPFEEMEEFSLEEFETDYEVVPDEELHEEFRNECDSFFAPGGTLETRAADAKLKCELRPQQRAMANAIVTRQDTIPQESKEKHALIFGKYLQ